jgi:hypothetical protein
MELYIYVGMATRQAENRRKCEKWRINISLCLNVSRETIRKEKEDNFDSAYHGNQPARSTWNVVHRKIFQ